MIEVHPTTDALLSTPAQHELEIRATQLFEGSAMQVALSEVYALARQQPQALLPSGEETLPQAMQELAFAFVIRNLNTDPFRPRILWDQHPPHRYGNVRIPGSRAIGNNPDNIYRRIPLNPAERYVIRGRLVEPTAPDVSFSVLPDVSMQANWRQTTLTLAEVDVNGDGSFELTMNGDSVADKNHVHLAPGATRMTIRESMTDWARDTPLGLALLCEGIEQYTHTGVEPTAQDLAERLPAFAEHWLTFNNRTYFAHPSNTFPQAERPPGGLVGQTSVMGNYALTENEVLIVRAGTLDASYLSFALMDPWMRCADFELRTASLTANQALPDPDGWYTVVIALEDPGVHNWLDPGGLSEGALQIRWQGIPDTPKPDRFFDVRMAPKQQLENRLPKDTMFVGPNERADQLALRTQAFNRRFVLKAPQT